MHYPTLSALKVNEPSPNINKNITFNVVVWCGVVFWLSFQMESICQCQCLLCLIVLHDYVSLLVCSCHKMTF